MVERKRLENVRAQVDSFPPMLIADLHVQFVVDQEDARRPLCP
jgi:hypothetical protein